MLRSWWLGFAIWLAATGSGFSQASEFWRSEEELPSAPASMVLDRGDLLTRKPELARRISEKLLALRQDTGFELYLMIQSGLCSDEPLATASKLQDPWVPKRNGLVMVFETDSKRVAFGRPFLTDSNLGGVMPSLDTVAVIAKAAESIDRKLSDEQLVEILVDRLCEGFRGRLQQAAEPLPAGRTLRFGLFAVGSVSALALAALIVGWLVKRSNDHKARRYWFTEIDRPERLGAPFGGGSVSVRRFKS